MQFNMLAHQWRESELSYYSSNANSAGLSIVTIDLVYREEGRNATFASCIAA